MYSRLDVASDTCLCNLSLAFGVVDLLVGDTDILSSDIILVWSLHVFVEDVHCDRNETGMGDPSTVMTGLNLSLLVFSDLVHGSFIGSWVVLDRDQSSHSSHSSDLSSTDQRCRIQNGMTHL